MEKKKLWKAKIQIEEHFTSKSFIFLTDDAIDWNNWIQQLKCSVLDLKFVYIFMGNNFPEVGPIHKLSYKHKIAIQILNGFILKVNNLLTWNLHFQTLKWKYFPTRMSWFCVKLIWYLSKYLADLKIKSW